MQIVHLVFSSTFFMVFKPEKDGTLTEKIVKHVYCVIKGEKEIKIYDV